MRKNDRRSNSGVQQGVSTVKHILDPQQVEALSEEAETPIKSLLPKLLFQLGLRAVEVENLDRSDLSKKGDIWEVSVRDQMKDETRVLLLDCCKELETWLKNHPRSEEDDFSLLVDRDGETIPHHYINRILKHLGQEAQESNPQLFGNDFEPENLTIYDFRKSSAHHKINRSDLNEAQVRWWFSWATNKPVENHSI